MQNPTEERPLFDERAALEELERLRGQIQRYAAERRAAEEQFDSFVQSFKGPRDAGSARPAPDLVRRRMPPDPGVPAAMPQAAAPAARPLPESPIAEAPAAAAPLAPAEPREPASPRKAGGDVSRPAIVGGALIVIAAGGFIAWMMRERPPQATTQPPASSATRASGAATTPPATATPASTPSSQETELVTIRPVWLRVTADGARVLERELPANARVPLTARKSIVIRTGDAGAVRLTIGGRDQGFLGREGEVVTRTFTVPPAQRQQQ